MDKKTLILFSGRWGSTEKAGRIIFEYFKVKSLHADIANISHGIDIQKYERIIIGSPVYYGKPDKFFREFLGENRGVLKKMEVFLFFTCMRLTRTGEEVYSSVFTDRLLDEGFKQIKKMGGMEKSHSLEVYMSGIANEISFIKPESLAFFKGDLIFRKMDLISRVVMKIMAMFMEQVKEGEFINRDEISKWLSTYFSG